MPFQQFSFVVSNLGLPLPEGDLNFLAENYLGPALPGQTRGIDYRKLLSDLKLHGTEPPKTLQGLTVAQKQVIQAMTKVLRD